MAPSLYHQPSNPPTPCIRVACQDVSQTCRLPPVTYRPSVGQIHITSPTLPLATTRPMCLPPQAPPKTTKPMQAVISRLVPQTTVQHVQPVPSVHCQRSYGVKTSDGTSLVLVAPAPPMVRLLRSERTSVISEAAVLQWLSNDTVERPLLQERTPEPEDNMPIAAIAVKGPGETGLAVRNAPEDLQVFLPRLLAHTAASTEGGREYNLLRPTMGVPVSELSPPLSPPERKEIDFQTGQFYRRLCTLTSPTGRFGPAFAVLPPATPNPPSEPNRTGRRDVNGRMMESKGVQSWSTAFHSMLEAVLRDGEDMQVMLGYGTIRRHFKRFQHTLDEVTVPRLVAVDARKDANTLVMRKRRRTSTVSPASSRRTSPRAEDREDLESDDEPDSELDELDQVTLHNQSSIIMAGMKDWSNFVFGDPLFAVNFSREPSNEFLSGFNGHSPIQGGTTSVLSSDMVEDVASAHVRLLLYECYHTVTHIAREFFRPRKDSSGRELEARKKLNSILTQLDALDDADSQRGRRPSGEVSPPKRSKSSEKDE